MSSESFERAASAPVLLVGVDFGVPHFDDELEELGLLAQTAGLLPVARLTCKRKAPDAALFVGSGKADEIRMLALRFSKNGMLSLFLFHSRNSKALFYPHLNQNNSRQS